MSRNKSLYPPLNPSWKTTHHALESGEDILITGFGKFCVNDKTKRKGRKPQTGNSLMLDATRVVTLKCFRTLRRNLNKKKKEGNHRDRG